MMMHDDQTHIKRNCFSIGIISSNHKVGVTKVDQRAVVCCLEPENST
jgi:hypothetical protein